MNKEPTKEVAIWIAKSSLEFWKREMHTAVGNEEIDIIANEIACAQKILNNLINEVVDNYWNVIKR